MRAMHRSVAAASLASALFCLPLSAQNLCFDPNVGTDLLLGDDATAQGLALGFTFNFAGVAYTDVCVCSNGYVWLGPVAGPTTPAGGDYTPTVPELLNGPPRICPLWSDYNPAATGGGHVFFQTVPASGNDPAYAMITWNGVYEYGTTSPKTVQVRLDAWHQVTVFYGRDTGDLSGGTLNAAAIIGASAGGGAAANPVAFYPLPLVVTQDTFHEELAVPVAPAFPYTGATMRWVPTVPGYLIAEHACTPPASFTPFGRGCPQRVVPAVYEMFANTGNVMDLSNRSFLFLANGSGGYTLSQPGGAWFGRFANNLGAGDDTTHVLTLPFPFQFGGSALSAIVASSNGFLWMSPINGGTGCCNPVVATLLAGLPRIAGMWTDLNALTGAVYADLDPVTGQYVVTWDGVGEYGVTPVSNNTFQIALHPSGSFEIRYQTVQHGHPTRAALAGMAAGGAQDPGPTDLSAVTSQPIPGGEPLELNAMPGSLPVFGQTFTMRLAGLPTTAGFAVVTLTFQEAAPPIDLTGFGAPNCAAYANLFGPLFNVFLFPAGAPSVTLGLGIPANAALGGVRVVAQGAAPGVVAYPLGFKLSNGGRIRIGL